jgi:hypothetical protein
LNESLSEVDAMLKPGKGTTEQWTALVGVVTVAASQPSTWPQAIAALGVAGIVIAYIWSRTKLKGGDA